MPTLPRTLLAALTALTVQTAAADEPGGQYVGILPCADCPGIDLRLDLVSDGRFIERRVYRERDARFFSYGRWTRQGDRLTLNTCDNAETTHLHIDDADRLTLLDPEGNPIESPFNHTLYRSTLPAPLESDEMPLQCDPELTETVWQLVTLDGQSVEQKKLAQTPYLRFDAEPEARISGSTGCNRLMGGYHREGGSLNFSALATTRMACPDMAQEQAFTAALDATRGWRIKADELVLIDTNGHTLARFRSVTEAP